jgi:hypothetical protein
MTSRVSRGSVHAWIRLATWPVRTVLRACRMLLMAVAGALGAPAPKFLRQEDPAVQVDEDEAVHE